ncbi:adhesion G-protein coupled receptor D1-like [Dendronephthya gigantea]|uniref:adhesion G-protein coupled receptor D1-like n=1 Tax=Dendronephthya gigantea TaxID=151771 RepID=UPI00106B70B4|nr:adhesion G-protein coupled receptor D1-like [Dendronephthya gigantea]
MDIGKKDLLTKGEQEVLEIVSTVGSSLSLAGVLLTILAYVLQWKRLHKDGKSKISSKVLMNLCVAIGMANFLSILSGPARNHEPYCITVSLLLYFFILALFGWMLCEGIVIYLKMVNVYASLALGGKHMQAFYVVGWGFPVIIVSLQITVNGLIDVTSEHACWCRAGGVMFWSFLVTVGLILLVR